LTSAIYDDLAAPNGFARFAPVISESKYYRE
jgi:hypothetical protein